jgi:hypothetical protein
LQRGPARVCVHARAQHPSRPRRRTARRTQHGSAHLASGVAMAAAGRTPPWHASSEGGVEVSNLDEQLSREDVLYLFERYGEARRGAARVAAACRGAARGLTAACSRLLTDYYGRRRLLLRVARTQVTWLDLRRGSCQLRYADARDAEHVAKVLSGARCSAS